MFDTTHFKKYTCLSLIAISIGLINACGSGESVKSSNASAQNGLLVDSGVAGVNYQTATQSGVTGANGEYKYLPGEKVTFSIGNITFPEVDAKGTLTPLDIAKTTDINNPMVVNIIRLLQTLDQDNNPNNGITIDSSITTTALDFSQSTTDFANAVQSQMSVTLISEADAISHFQSTLDDLSGKNNTDSLPASIIDTSITMKYTASQAGSPYSNDDMVKFSFSNAGKLSIDTNPAANDGNEVDLANFSKVGSEFIWEDVANQLKYALSMNGNAINEINVMNTNNGFLGQFITDPGAPAVLYNLSGTISGVSSSSSGQWELKIGGAFAHDGALANGAVSYNASGVADGAAYEVTVQSPSGQNCVVSNGSGTISGNHIGNIDIVCTDVAAAAFTIQYAGPSLNANTACDPNVLTEFTGKTMVGQFNADVYGFNGDADQPGAFLEVFSNNPSAGQFKVRFVCSNLNHAWRSIGTAQELGLTVDQANNTVTFSNTVLKPKFAGLLHVDFPTVNETIPASQLALTLNGSLTEP